MVTKRQKGAFINSFLVPISVENGLIQARNFSRSLRQSHQPKDQPLEPRDSAYLTTIMQSAFGSI